MENFELGEIVQVKIPLYKRALAFFIGEDQPPPFVVIEAWDDEIEAFQCIDSRDCRWMIPLRSLVRMPERHER